MEKWLIFRSTKLGGRYLFMYDICLFYSSVNPIASEPFPFPFPFPFQPSPSPLVCKWRTTKALIQSEKRLDGGRSSSARRSLRFQEKNEGTFVMEAKCIPTEQTYPKGALSAPQRTGPTFRIVEEAFFQGLVFLRDFPRPKSSILGSNCQRSKHVQILLPQSEWSPATRSYPATASAVLCRTRKAEART